MTTTCWLIGSYKAWPSQTMTFGGDLSGAEEVAASLGGLYLHHGTTALSCFDQVVSAMTSAGATDPYCRFNANGKIQLGHTGANFTVTWTDTLLRDFLGYTGNLSGDTDYEADTVSPYWWSPLRPDNPMKAPLGVRGLETGDIGVTSTPDGALCVTDTGTTITENAYVFTHILKERYWTSDEDAGEYLVFHQNVGRKGYLFTLLRNVDEDASSSSAASITISNAIGPYALDPKREGFIRIPFARQFPNVEKSYRFTMNVIGPPEYA